MQEIFVIVTVGAAIFFLGKMIFKQFFSKSTKCEGCAVGKMAEKG